MRAQRGFTLVEVMIALAILAVGLAVLIKSTASNIASTEGSYMSTVVTDLARGEMYEIEEKLAKEGFQDTDDHQCGDFDKDGWHDVAWCYDVIAVDLPELGSIQQMAQQKMQGSGAGSGSGSGSGSGAGSGSDDSGAGAFGNSTLGSMLSMYGGMGGGMGGMGGSGGSGGWTGADAKGGQFIAMQYEIVKQVLKASIRKVKLTVTYTVVGQDMSFDVVEYVTDAAGMNKVLGSLGASPGGTGLPGQSGGSSGSGSGKGSTTTTPPGPTR